jgi:hypothetical protein
MKTLLFALLMLSSSISYSAQIVDTCNSRECPNFKLNPYDEIIFKSNTSIDHANKLHKTKCWLYREDKKNLPSFSIYLENINCDPVICQNYIHFVKKENLYWYTYEIKGHLINSNIRYGYIKIKNEGDESMLALCTYF